MMARVVVLGASGHTGRLVVGALKRRGAVVDALARSTGGPDVRDRTAVRMALAGADAVVNLAGPFLRQGLAPVQAAIDAGVPYVDTTGEQAFMRKVDLALQRPARDAGVPVVNALAYEYAYGDLAARAFFPEGGDALHVFYRNIGAAPSAGTKKSILRVLASPTLAYEDGVLRRAPTGRWRRTFSTERGERLGLSFAGGEVLTVPRHTPFRTVRTYIQTNPKNARLSRALAPAARVALHGPVMALAERIVDARHEAPQNAEARGEVHLVAEPGGRRVVVSTPDPYVATAEIAAEGAMRLAARKGHGGVLAPAEAFDAREMLDAMRAAMIGFGVAEFTR